MRAFTAVMYTELGSEAISRWRKRLAAELDQAVARVAPPRSHAIASAALPTARPRLTIAVLDAMRSSEALSDGGQVRVSFDCCVGVEGGVTKILARRVADFLRQRRAGDVLCAGGEISVETLSDTARLAKTLSRTIQETFAHVHAAAEAVRGEGDEVAVLELHSAEQTLAGKSLRGCGLVFCPKGQRLVECALGKARAELESLLSSSANREEEPASPIPSPTARPACVPSVDLAPSAT